MNFKFFLASSPLTTCPHRRVISLHSSLLLTTTGRVTGGYYINLSTRRPLVRQPFNTLENMAIGPFVRILAQVVVPVIAVLARALPKAYGEALRNARKAGVDNASTAATASNMLRRTISKSEALQILNLTEAKATPEAVQKVSTMSIIFHVVAALFLTLLNLLPIFLYAQISTLYRSFKNSNMKSTWQPMIFPMVEAFTCSPKCIGPRNS